MTNPLDKAVKYTQSLHGFAESVTKHETVEDYIAAYHHLAGRYLRNKLGLWDYTSELSKYFYSELSLRHADDMSSIILGMAYCDHKGEDFNLLLEAIIYHGFWRSHYEQQWSKALERVMKKVDKKIQYHKQTPKLLQDDGEIVKITEGQIND